VEFKKGAAYGTINSYRSALSLIFDPKIAEYVEIKRLFKGAANIRPRQPRHELTWDPKVILDFVSTWPSMNDGLTLKKLA